MRFTIEIEDFWLDEDDADYRLYAYRAYSR